MASDTGDTLPVGVVVTGAVRAPLPWKGHPVGHCPSQQGEAVLSWPGSGLLLEGVSQHKHP